MTINVGFHLDKYILLAADTRTVYLSAGVRQYFDGYEKIIETPFGLVTGAGYKSLLDDVKAEFSRINSLTTVNSLMEIIRRTYDQHQNEMKILEAQMDVGVTTTSWMFTYTTVKSSTPILRLGVFHPDISQSNIAHYKAGNPGIIMPYEAGKEYTNLLYEKLQDKLDPLQNISNIRENIRYHIKVLKELITEVSSRFDSVSPDFYAKAHCVDSTISSMYVDSNGHVTQNH